MGKSYQILTGKLNLNKMEALTSDLHKACMHAKHTQLMHEYNTTV